MEETDALGPSLRQLLERVEPAEDHPLLNGIELTKDIHEEVDEPLKSLIPAWLVEALTTYDIATMIIRFEDVGGEERAIQFAGFDEMWDHFFSVLPGREICYLGYVVIGEDPTNGDKPYFVKASGGSRTPIYRLADGYTADVQVSGHPLCKVADSLEEILLRQLRQ